MGRIINALLGRKATEAPKGESPVLPAYGSFPDGIRMAIVVVNGITWELIHHPAEEMISFRHLDDKDSQHGPAFQLHNGHIAEMTVEKGTLLHPKKLKAIRGGAWLDGLEPNTYFAAADTGEYDMYVLTHADAIRFLLEKVAGQGSSAPEGFADVSKAGATDGEGNGGRVGEQPPGSDAGGSEDGKAPRAQDARGSVDQS
jgi:hypothetical protein